MKKFYPEDKIIFFLFRDEWTCCVTNKCNQVRNMPRTARDYPLCCQSQSTGIAGESFIGSLL